MCRKFDEKHELDNEDDDNKELNQYSGSFENVNIYQLFILKTAKVYFGARIIIQLYY